MIPDSLGAAFARIKEIEGLLDRLTPEVAPTETPAPTSPGSFQQALAAQLQPAAPGALLDPQPTAATRGFSLPAAAGLDAIGDSPLGRTDARGWERNLPSAAMAEQILTGRTGPGGSPSKAADKAPAAYRKLVQEAARKYGVDEALILGVMQTESDFDPRCVSSAGAMGLMQLMPANVEEYGISDAFDPAQNIDAGVRHLRDMLRRYDGDVKLALAGYNAGPGNVAKYGGVPPFAETQNYIPKVLARAAAFRQSPAPAPAATADLPTLPPVGPLPVERLAKVTATASAERRRAVAEAVTASPAPSEPDHGVPPQHPAVVPPPVESAAAPNATPMRETTTAESARSVSEADAAPVPTTQASAAPTRTARPAPSRPAPPEAVAPSEPTLSTAPQHGGDEPSPAGATPPTPRAERTPPVDAPRPQVSPLSQANQPTELARPAAPSPGVSLDRVAPSESVALPAPGEAENGVPEPPAPRSSSHQPAPAARSTAPQATVATDRPAAPQATVATVRPAAPQTTVATDRPAVPQTTVATDRPAAPQYTVAVAPPAAPEAAVVTDQPAAPQTTVATDRPAAPRTTVATDRPDMPQHTVATAPPHPVPGDRPAAPQPTVLAARPAAPEHAVATDRPAVPEAMVPAAPEAADVVSVPRLSAPLAAPHDVHEQTLRAVSEAAPAVPATAPAWSVEADRPVAVSSPNASATVRLQTGEVEVAAEPLLRQVVERLPGLAVTQQAVGRVVQDIVEPVQRLVEQLGEAVSQGPAESKPPAATPPAAPTAARPATELFERPTPSRSGERFAPMIAQAATPPTQPATGSDQPRDGHGEQRSAPPTTTVRPAADAAQPAVFSLAQASRPQPVAAADQAATMVLERPEDLSAEVVRRARLLRSPGRDEFSVELRHPEAGTVSVRVVREAQAVHVSLTCAHAGLRRELQAQLPELQSALREQGLQLGSFDTATPQQHQTFGGSGSGQAQQQQSAARQREAALFTHLAQPEETPDDNRPDGQVGLAVWA